MLLLQNGLLNQQPSRVLDRRLPPLALRMEHRPPQQLPQVFIRAQLPLIVVLLGTVPLNLSVRITGQWGTTISSSFIPLGTEV